jgi:hypothetical protein
MARNIRSAQLENRTARFKMGDLHAAKYWYGRAIEENPHVRIDSREGRKRLEHVTIDHVVAPHEYVIREIDPPAD